MMKLRHTVGVERLRDIPGCERAHPAVTAVVERLGSHVKVCVVSRLVPYYGQAFDDMSLRRHPHERTVRAAMEARAQSVARAYGATYVTDRPADPTTEPAPSSPGARLDDISARMDAAYAARRATKYGTAEYADASAAIEAVYDDLRALNKEMAR